MIKIKMEKLWKIIIFAKKSRENGDTIPKNNRRENLKLILV